MKSIIIPLISQPGIQRDGTPYDSPNYIDGQWVRFYKGKPRKMGGYVLIDRGGLEITNSLYSISQTGNTIDLYYGRPSTIAFANYNQNITSIGTEIDRTPTSNFIPNPNNTWTMDLFSGEDLASDPAPTVQYIIAHAGQNALDISNTVNTTVFWGNAIYPANQTQVLQSIFLSTGTGTDGIDPPYTATTTPLQISGGIVFISPILIGWGNNGTLIWSVPGSIIFPTAAGSMTAINPLYTKVVTNNKIVRVMSARGSNVTALGQNAPSVLIWSLNSLIRANYVTVNAIATFTTQIIQNNISILSANSIIEYNQVFYWVGQNQFFQFTGIVSKLNNEMNQEYFFNTLNYDYRGLIFAFANPRYDELWWCYASGDSIVPDRAVIHNIRYEIWYDTAINRSAAIIPVTSSNPVMADNLSIITKTRNLGPVTSYPIWKHEVKLDKVIDDRSYPIQSFFQTHLIDLFSNNPDNNNMIWVRRIEPDFAQNTAVPSSNMLVSIISLMYPNDQNAITYGPFIIAQNAPFIDNINAQGAIVSLRFESNSAGGFYQAGKTLLNYTIGNERK